MAGETTLTVVGNLAGDVELRFTSGGDPVANFTVASTPRVLDKQQNQWKDGDPLFLRCSIWRQAAENAAESLSKGDRVMVTGRLKQRSFQDREGNNRTVIELDVDELGVSLRYATARPNKAGRPQQQNGAAAYGQPQPNPYQQPQYAPQGQYAQPQQYAAPPQQQQQPQQQPQPAGGGYPPADDPWNRPPPGNYSSNEPPF